MYDPAKYIFDSNRDSTVATLAEGAVLYRLCSMHFCTPDSVLNGKGPTMGRVKGRFNEPDQLTSYCANNVFICLSEIRVHQDF